MFNYRKTLGIFALVCSIASLAGCGGASGTKSDTTPIKTCGNFQIVLEDGSCGAPPPPPPCPDGYIRANPDSACVKSDFVPPKHPTAAEVREILKRDPGDDYAVIYLNKTDKAFAGYTLYKWQSCGNGWLNPSAGWEDESEKIQGIEEAKQDEVYGAYFVVPTSPAGTCGNFIIRSAGRAQQTNDLSLSTVPTGSPFDRRYFVIANLSNLRDSRISPLPICINDKCEAYAKPKLSISDISAHWIDTSTILWDQNVTEVKLYAAQDGKKISANDDGTVANGTVVAELSASTITADQQALVPHLQNLHAYSLDLSAETIKGLLKRELVIVGKSDGALVGTRLQTPQILDALYTAGNNDANEAKLGLDYQGNNLTASVWAPTASKVELRVYGADLKIESTKTMTENTATGIWSYTAAKSELDRKFYRYRVTVFDAFTNKIEVLEVTDPESVSLSTNGLHSQFVNLNDSDLKPSGWDGQVVPEVSSPEEISIYETHVRDFSIDDQSTPVAHRGKYLAFTDSDSAPVKHLKALADAGMTHVHLLPIADGSSVNEDFSKQLNLDSYVFELCAAVQPRNSLFICDGHAEKEKANDTIRAVLKKYPGDSSKQRDIINALSDLDGFNWNYDPEHYNAPEGSYSTNPNGVTRILEARSMNMALHSMGLRVVMDVVYPHMTASGVATANSTFDKIVPGYYFRQNIVSGAVENGTSAGADTATEHVMAAKFVSDSLVQWTTQYKVDGFRFDQSGYMPKATLVNAYNAVKAVDPDNYFYAEAWSPVGGTVTNRVDQVASQVPLAGTGIGTFNDRIRNPLRQLSLVNGGDLDAVRAGLAGNLSEFKLLAKSGKTIKASTVGAYNLDPQEAVNYVDKHDNEALWDWMHRPNALPANTSIENRVRIQDLTLSVPILSQGVAFFQAGTDILRSKSMSSNSYNSGDWFNVIDFTKQTNNWRVGLPPTHDTSDANILAAFADEQSKPTPTLIQKSSDVFNEFLKIAKSSPLFSLTTADQVFDRVGFHDGGTTQSPNLIVMSIDDGAGKVVGGTESRIDLDPNVDAIVVIFNGGKTAVTKQIATSTGFVLHSIQQNSVDSAVRTASFSEGTGGGAFTVPAYTTAIFVKPQAGAQGAGLSSIATSGYEPPVPYGDTDLYVRGQVSSAGWDATSVNKMKYEGKGIYSAYLTIPGGAAIFKIAEANWSQPNLGGGQEVVLNTPVTLVQGSNANLSSNLPAGEYKFQLNALQSITAPVLTVTKADVYGDKPLYARGEITPAGWDTPVNTNNLMTYIGHSNYDLMVPTAISGRSNAYQFKFGAADWANGEAGSGPDGRAILVGTPKELVRTGGQNIEVTVLPADAGNYSIRLNSQDPNAPIATIYKDDVYSAIPLYVRGTVALGWDFGDANKLTYVGHGLYTKTFTITASETPYEFKVADKDWTGPTIFGPGNTTLGSGLSDVHTNIGITISVTGDYKFTFDTATTPRTITVTKVN